MEMFSVFVYTLVFYSGHRVEKIYLEREQCEKAYALAIDDTRGSPSVTAFACMERELFPKAHLVDFNRYYQRRADAEKAKKVAE